MADRSALNDAAKSSKLVHRYGPWAIVTGASEGIGRAFAMELAARGFNLVLVARRRQLLDALAAELRSKNLVEVLVVDVDLTRPEASSAIDAATATLDVGLLVAAAGFGSSGALLQASIEEELLLIDLNCKSILEQAQRFGQRFAARGNGGIVFLSSLVAWQGAPLAANYAASKAYVQSLAEGLRIELSPLNVDVLALAPGPVQSGFGARARMQMGLASSPESVARSAILQLGRQGTIVPGLLSKFLTYSLATLPRAARVRMMGGIMRGMTRHQHATATIQNPKRA